MNTVTVPEYRELMTNRMSEKEFHWHVVRMARELGWIDYHTWDSRRSNPGFPDILFVRERLVWAELKSARGRLSFDQEAWITKLRSAGQEVYVWKPSDWDEIHEVLS